MRSSTESKIYFFFQTPVSLLRHRTRLKKFLETLFNKEKKSLQSLNYIFCTDKQLLEINRQYLQHDYYTDIITFELSAKEMPVEGEVYISIDRIRDNAQSHHEPVYIELHRVIFHGALHLCGYKDKTRQQSATMRRKENEYLSLFFE
ncbi:rRNA maturation RNase YbeY [Terrimonas pollutisoli]|uniref:rRNA maturation RNase YbeY n=1 Tax=Terrimonas pollutisoli TaxID=3034147 RepID=UPI0023EC01A7|nr:rRNA maturation RNase YbeY [Terrimonas sp. H1YJ31]